MLGMFVLPLALGKKLPNRPIFQILGYFKWS